MVRENQRIRHHNVLPPPRSKHHDLRNIITCQRLHTLVNLLRLLLVAPKPDHTELRLDLPRINLNDPDATRNQLLAQRIRERPHGGLGCAVDRAPRVRLAAGNRADVYNITAAAIGAGEEDGQDGLCHGDEAGDVGLEHGVDVGGFDFRGFVDALDEAAASN